MADARYDPDNIFAKILRGEIPCHRVYEDAHTLAFMDVMPQGEGHTLVIPKAPARGLLDAEPESLSALMTSVQTVARAVKAAFRAEGLTLFQFNEPAGGQTVFHLHVHIIPRWQDQPLGRHGGGMAGAGELNQLAGQIAQHLG